jgi:hypothetical protein
MKKLMLFGAAVSLLALLAGGYVQGLGLSSPAQPKKGGGPTVVHQKTVVVNRTPAPVGNHVPPAPVKTVVKNQPTIVVNNIQQKFPTTAVDRKTFVESNQHKFVGVGQKPVVVKDYPRVTVPQLTYKGKGNHPVLDGYRDKFKPVAGAKVRPEFVTNYDKHWNERMDHWHERGHDLRGLLGANYYHLYSHDWWTHYHGPRVGWWARYPAFADRWFAFTHWEWWRPAPWQTIINWVIAPTVWAAPFYYDYGGNVIYDNNVVYVQDQPIASAEDYAAQAIQLAQSGAALLNASPPSPDNIQNQWLPLGSFAVANAEQGEPTMFLQLAVNKQGVIAGTFVNDATGDSQPVLGAVDPKTQRAAWFLGNTQTTVMETGVYNLSEAETPVLVHFGPTQTQTWFLVRLQEPPK